MTKQQLASFDEASARIGRSAREEAFGLHVGKVPKRAAARTARAKLRKAWHRFCQAARHATGAVAFASIAAATAALLTGVAFVGHAGTADLRIATHRAPVHAGDHGYISVDPLIVAQASAPTALHITVSQSSGAPAGGFVRVRGLPPATSLTKGHAMGPGTWAVPLDQVSGLQMKVAAGAEGKARLTFALVAARGEQLAEAHATLMLRDAPHASPAALAAVAKPQSDHIDLPPRQARGKETRVPPRVAHNATPRLVRGQAGRKQRVRHLAQPSQRIAAKPRKTKAARAVEEAFRFWRPAT